MPTILAIRRYVLLGALLASQALTACVIVPVPYHRHRPHVIYPYPVPAEPVPRDPWGPRGRGERGRH
jgi:hypothetical protein